MAEIEISCTSCLNPIKSRGHRLGDACGTCGYPPKKIFKYDKIKWGSINFAYKNWYGPGPELEEFLLEEFFEKELFEI